MGEVLRARSRATATNGKPDKPAVYWVMQSLDKDKLVVKKRGSWMLTQAGQKAAPAGRKAAQGEMSLEALEAAGL
ncbi:MAG: hypothetical protein ACLQF1_19970 [Methyloceanibacter sp.]